MTERTRPEPRRRIEAMVRPALLRCRETSNYSLDRVADRLKVNPDKLRAWEEGGLRPSIAQLALRRNVGKRWLSR
jgi:DNA-binding transcriptional regulator YiaG